MDGADGLGSCVRRTPVCPLPRARLPRSHADFGSVASMQKCIFSSTRTHEKVCKLDISDSSTRSHEVRHRHRGPRCRRIGAAGRPRPVAAVGAAAGGVFVGRSMRVARVPRGEQRDRLEQWPQPRGRRHRAASCRRRAHRSIPVADRHSMGGEDRGSSLRSRCDRRIVRALHHGVRWLARSPRVVVILDCQALRCRPRQGGRSLWVSDAADRARVGCAPVCVLIASPATAPSAVALMGAHRGSPLFVDALAYARVRAIGLPLALASSAARERSVAWATPGRPSVPRRSRRSSTRRSTLCSSSRHSVSAWQAPQPPLCWRRP